MTMTIPEVAAFICVLVVLNSKSTWEFGITPGFECGNDKYTSFVALAINKDRGYMFFGGGILITSNHVLTTKKRIIAQPQHNIFAVFAYDTVNETIKKVVAITMHESNPEDRDICLLRLQKSIELPHLVVPMCLPTMYKIGSILLGRDVPSAEWYYKGNSIMILNTDDMKIITKHECDTYFDHAKDLLCGIKPRRQPSIGGILYKKMPHLNGEKYVLMGMIVEAKPSDDEENIIASIDVSYYLEWIQLNIV